MGIVDRVRELVLPGLDSLGLQLWDIEYKKEGQVFGIGCKIFTIAGPVILYGIFTSWVLGLIYWIWGMVA